MGLDHLLGRPSPAWKRMETMAVMLMVLGYVDKHKDRIPRAFRFLNRYLNGLMPWQIVLMTLLGKYVANRLFLLLFMNPPEVYARHYNRNFYRATWILTALDAGFWTALPIKPGFIRQPLSLILAVWYLFHANDADIKVGKMRSQCTVKMLRVAWEKQTSPIIWALTYPLLPRLKCIKEIHLPRTECEVGKYPNWRCNTRIKIYYDGHERNLRYVHNVILHFPGGGFVAMAPENHEDPLRDWAKHLGKKVAIISVDYAKAPEFPYPYALDECFEIYEKLCETNGHCLGINTASAANKYKTSSSGKPFRRLKIALAGDSAGGNLSICVTMKIIMKLREYKQNINGTPLQNRLPLNLQVTSYQQKRNSPKIWLPEGLLIVYGALNFDMASWIAPSDVHAKLLRPGSETSLSGLMKNYKGRKYHKNRLSFSGSNDEYFDRPLSQEPNGTVSEPGTPRPAVPDVADLQQSSTQIEQFPGLNIPYLSFTSRISYFNDRIITPELTRAMALWYLGSNTTRNPATDMFLSPVNAPEDILAEFPRMWMMCGECDPFVDDTVIFAARVRQAVARKNRFSSSASNSGDSTDYDTESDFGSSTGGNESGRLSPSESEFDEKAVHPILSLPSSAIQSLKRSYLSRQDLNLLDDDLLDSDDDFYWEVDHELDPQNSKAQIRRAQLRWLAPIQYWRYQFKRSVYVLRRKLGFESSKKESETFEDSNLLSDFESPTFMENYPQHSPSTSSFPSEDDMKSMNFVNEEEPERIDSNSPNEYASSSESDNEDELYGEVSRDKIDHVTVKVYAGLSHAFLQMKWMLPESSHAIGVCGRWLAEIIEGAEWKRKRKRRKMLMKKLGKNSVMMAPEIRDEDNIPNSIDLPFGGAEYRLGGQTMRLKSNEPKKVHSRKSTESPTYNQALDLHRTTRKNTFHEKPGKHELNGSVRYDQLEATPPRHNPTTNNSFKLPVHDDGCNTTHDSTVVPTNEIPISEAFNQNKIKVRETGGKRHKRHDKPKNGKKNGSSKKSGGYGSSKRRIDNSKKTESSDGRPLAEVDNDEPKVLSEFDLVNKRRDNITREVYYDRDDISNITRSSPPLTDESIVNATKPDAS